jgi:hypothetical protein
MRIGFFGQREKISRVKESPVKKITGESSTGDGEDAVCRKACPAMMEAEVL